MAIASVLLPLVRLSLARRGFVATAHTLANRSDRIRASHDITSCRATAEAVAAVAGRPLVGARCLGRSLVLWFMLRRRGVDAELVIGAEPPLGGTLPAHAWVEVDGEPVNDVADVRGRFGSFGVSLPRLSDAPHA